MQMRRNFLTVGDKNPIMFNDMLCECARVEIGPQLGGWGGAVIFKRLPPLSAAALNCTRARTHVHAHLSLLFFFFLKLMKLTLPSVLRQKGFLRVGGAAEGSASLLGVLLPSKCRFTWLVSGVPVIGLLACTRCRPRNSTGRCAVIYLVSKEYIHHGEITHLNMTLQQEY